MIDETKTFDSDFFELAEPKPAVLVESLRAIGYSLPSAVADLVDNSISAGAKNIWISGHWSGGNSYLIFTDDGAGMSETELLQAMTLGSKSPLDERNHKDLGRFGMGLKTASFSQCTQLTVQSKRENKAFTREWDLEHLRCSNGWYLRKTTDTAGADILRQSLSSIDTGTSILWRGLDRITTRKATADDERAHDHFLENMTLIEEHLALTFHRLLAKKNGVKIFVDGHRIKPFDPFLSENDFTQEYPEEHIPSSGGTIRVRGFVLPHPLKLTEDLNEKVAGTKGWTRLQGLYIYRNDRLLVSGGWSGLQLKAEEQFKLARVCVDIPNTADTAWDLDIKKSRARPPLEVRGRLKQICQIIRERSRQTYRSKGKVFTRHISKNFAPVWREIWDGKRVSFQINREHPLIINSLAEPSTQTTKILLRLVEETMPFEQIWSHLSDNPHAHKESFEGVPKDTGLEDTLKLLAHVLKNTKMAADELERRLLEIEPFNKYPELVSETIRRGTHNV